MTFAYLSGGKLFVKDDEKAPIEIESHFGKEVIERSIRMHQRNEWKTKSRDNTPFSGSMLWGVTPSDPRISQVRILGATRSAEANALFFVLQTETTGGLFLYDFVAHSEKRIFHREQFRAHDLDWHPEHRLIVCSQSFQNGTANIVTMNAEGHDVHQLTEGDSVDEAPSWMPGSERRILFQSAGMARNQHGYAVGTGPFAIQQVDLERNSLTTILEDDAYDFLLPHAGANGDLYFIRRPYEKPGRSNYGIVQGVTDLLLLPFRLLRALFHFLNFLSMTFSQKPLTTVSGPKMEGEDEQTLMLRGRIIDAKKLLQETKESQDSPALVPNTWELIRRTPSGDEAVLAKSVAAFDIAGDGNILYTNGSAVYTVDHAGKSTRIMKGKLLEHVTCLT
jgi:hypothetical protein